MPIDFTHPHIQQHNSCHVVSSFWGTGLFKGLRLYLSLLCRSRYLCPLLLQRPLAQPRHAVEQQQPGPPRVSSRPDLVLFAGPALPTITLTPCASALLAEEVVRIDDRLLAPPRVARFCIRGLRCKCARCVKRRNARIAVLKARRKRVVVRQRDAGDAGDQSEIEG